MYGKYSMPVQIFFRKGRPGGARPSNVNLGPPISRKVLELKSLKWKTQLDMVKYSRWVQKYFR